MKSINKTTLNALFSILTIVAALGVLLFNPANAGLLDSMMNSSLPEVPTTDKYEIKTYGYDSRVYEWTPKHNPNISCVFVASSKSSGVACYPKEK